MVTCSRCGATAGAEDYKCPNCGGVLADQSGDRTAGSQGDDAATMVDSSSSSGGDGQLLSRRAMLAGGGVVVVAAAAGGGGFVLLGGDGGSGDGGDGTDGTNGSGPDESGTDGSDGSGSGATDGATGDGGSGTQATPITSPIATFKWTFDPSANTLTVQMEAGEQIRADYLVFVGTRGSSGAGPIDDSGDSPGLAWNGETVEGDATASLGGDPAVTAGDGATVPDVGGDFDLDLVWVPGSMADSAVLSTDSGPGA